MADEIFLKGGLRVESLRGDLTQAEFAERLDVDRKTVGQWERGERVPSGTVLLRMASEFGADVGYILTGKKGGVAPQLPPDEEQLLAHYRAAHSDARERIRQIAATAANSPKRDKKAPDLVMGNNTQIATARGAVQVNGSGNTVLSRRKK